MVEDARTRGGAHALGREHVLDAERDAGERAALAFRELCVGRFGHRARPLRRLQHDGIERTRLVDGGKMCVGKLEGGDLFLTQLVARLRERQRGRIGHSDGGSSHTNAGAATAHQSTSRGAAGSHTKTAIA